MGFVSSYDADRGLGTVRVDGEEELGFHATAIADGSREIADGTRVAFLERPAHHGVSEAGFVTKLPDV